MLQGKTVVVTGGSRGIGAGLVGKLIERENHVIATTRCVKTALELQKLAAAHPQHLTITELDTAQPASIEAWAAGLKQHTQHVDVLVNNAGIYGRRCSFEEFTAEDFTAPFAANAVGPFLVTQQVYKQGLLQGKSLVVNMSSIMASQGDPTVSGVTGSGYAYRASKAALNIMSKAMQIDLGSKGVNVVLIHPGYVATDMTGGQGWVTVEESTTGIMKVLEDGRPLAGKWWSFNGDEIPW